MIWKIFFTGILIQTLVSNPAFGDINNLDPEFRKEILDTARKLLPTKNI